MIEKIEAVFDFVFKAFKWIVILAIIFMTAIMYKSCSGLTKSYEKTKSEFVKHK